jgi:uncharacterized protein (DUF2132 family)
MTEKISQIQKKNPLHGLTLKAILEELITDYGFPGLSEKIKIKCFIDKPSLSSSLVFLRKTPWAREKVENLYLYNKRQKAKKSRLV